MRTDERGLALSGADSRQAGRFDDCVRSWLEYRARALPDTEALHEEAPELAMATVLLGAMRMTSGLSAARPAVADALASLRPRLPDLTPRERDHVRALDAWAAGDPRQACAHWDASLSRHPTDLIALKLQHFCLFWLGRPRHMRDVLERVMPAWEPDVPGHSFVQGMHAFAMGEQGELAAAERLGRDAVEGCPDDLWAVHAVAHVLEDAARVQEGVAWLQPEHSRWEDRNPFRAHLWWHAALYLFSEGAFERVLELYDTRIRPDDRLFYLGLQNAASLLARLAFAGVDVGDRWEALADAASTRLDDAAVPFTHPHFSMVFAHARRPAAERAHLEHLERAAARHDEAGRSAAMVLSVCRAIGDLHAGRAAEAWRALRLQEPDFLAFGGSAAQRQILVRYRLDSAIASGAHGPAEELLQAPMLAGRHDPATRRARERLRER